MSHWVDRLAKSSARRASIVEGYSQGLGSPATRRQAFGIAGGFAAALTALRATPAGAQGPNECYGDSYLCGEGTCCATGDNCCISEQGVGYCCPAGKDCYVNGTCCAGPQKCGGDCCNADYFCCDPDRLLCCPQGDSCCASGPEGSNQCCPKPNRCAAESKPGSGGIEPGAPTLCCAPAQQPANFDAMCCAAGSVGEQTGKLVVTSHNGGGAFCCPEGTLCGGTCCTGTEAFPAICVDDSLPNGNGCRFDFAKMFPKATVDKDGEATLKSKFDSKAHGTVTIEADSNEVAVEGRRGNSPVPLVLGSAKIRARKPGKVETVVKLNRAGRKLIAANHKVKVNAVLAFEDGEFTVRTWNPVTLQAPKR